MTTDAIAGHHTTWYGRRNEAPHISRDPAQPDKLDRGRWLAAALDVLCETGWQDVRINPLCARLGVTKGSFYWHFESRDALLLAMLEAWEGAGTDAIIAQIDASPGSAAERVSLLLRTVFAESTRNDRIESAIRAWAASEPEAAAVVGRVDERRLAYVRDLLLAAGASPAVAAHRSALLYRTLIGEFTWRSHGGPAISPDMLEQLRQMLLFDAE